VLVQNAEGAPIVSAAGVAPGAALALHFADGQVGVVADGMKPPRRKSRAAGEQGALL
jgi:exodeoxyribonuclease VII large subunit